HPMPTYTCTYLRRYAHSTLWTWSVWQHTVDLVSVKHLQHTVDLVSVKASSAHCGPGQCEGIFSTLWT
ncbi:hypothetical protein STEG23_002170, partial [Scotinomys teguina]